MWQDFVLTIINFGFILTIIPAVYRNYKLRDASSQSLITYSSTALLLTIMSGIFYSLDLWLSSISTAGTAIMWYVLTYQKVHYRGP